MAMVSHSFALPGSIPTSFTYLSYVAEGVCFLASKLRDHYVARFHDTVFAEPLTTRVAGVPVVMPAPWGASRSARPAQGLFSLFYRRQLLDRGRLWSRRILE
jgi:hypothetical protein